MSRRILEACLAGAEPNDAGAVRADRRVVARQPETAGGIALAVRKLRQEDLAAGIELRLEPGRVVTRAGTVGERRRRERADETREQQPDPRPHAAHGSRISVRPVP